MIDYKEFVSLVKRMRDAQKDVIYKSMFSALDSARPTAYEVAKTKQIILEQEFDEYLKKMEDHMRHLEIKGTLGEFLDKIDEYFGLKDLSAEVSAVIDIKDKKDGDVQE